MIACVVLAIIAIFTSECPHCQYFDGNWLSMIMYGFRIQYFQFGEANSEYLVDFQMKYLLLSLIVVFAIGLMLRLEIFDTPNL